ncbi:hypothetical protein [Thomasclavelia cocleata]|jgi:hypothetical protein|uniref:hypothetical protein n=1 Tax=Thomasclavelia cocleata TaxID=69824 RepID=UPI002430787B|nr:hypothetical protein [Thomasclavelia cocleata]MCI9630121.1 hypothetical protein [Thomasclavelia cocleata]
MRNKLRLQITEKYKRNVFINVVVPEGRLYEFDKILDEYEDSYNDYKTLIGELSNDGFEVLFVDDNDSLFEFEETHDVDYSFINERIKEG